MCQALGAPHATCSSTPKQSKKIIQYREKRCNEARKRCGTYSTLHHSTVNVDRVPTSTLANEPRTMSKRHQYYATNQASLQHNCVSAIVLQPDLWQFPRCKTFRLCLPDAFMAGALARSPWELVGSVMLGPEATGCGLGCNVGAPGFNKYTPGVQMCGCR